MKKLFTMMLLAASASAMMAQGSQQIITGDRWFKATLPEFSYQGQVQMFVHENDYDNGTDSFVFYDDNFSQQGTLTVPGEAYDYTNKREERERKMDANGHYGYTGDWQVVEEESGTRYSGLIELDLMDFDQSCDDFSDIYITQTLFNKDEKYEYLMPILTPSTTYYYEYDRDGDGIIDYKETETGANMTGFKIVSETGTVLQSITFEKKFHTGASYPEGNVLKVNGKLYLYFRGSVDEGAESKRAYLIYSIDSSSNATSVRMKTMETFSATARYTLDGRRTKGERGINIVRMEDGTVKKVIEK